MSVLPPQSASVSLDLIVDRAGSTEIHRQVLAVFERLESDVYLEHTKSQLRDAIATGSDYWDLCCVLAAAGGLVRPDRYLEIGVRRGRSACVVAAAHPSVDLYLFDMWAADYAGVPNPGPEFVRGQLAAVGHRGRAVFVSGRSQQTMPAYFAGGSALTFHLATVDGDHRDAGALADLNQVFPRVACGGALVFDDIIHPGYPGLGKTWEEWSSRQTGLITRANRRDGTGTAVGWRSAD